MDGTALNLEQVNAVECKWFQRGKERARLVSKAQRQGHLASFRLPVAGSKGGRNEKHEPGEVFRVVLNAFGKNHAVIVVGGGAARDGRRGFVAARQNFSHASRGVFGRHTLEIRMSDEELFTLREGHRMRGDGTNVRKGGSGTSDEVMLNGKNRLSDDGEITFQEEIVNTHDRSRERVFHGSEQGIGTAFRDGAKGGIEGRAGNRGDPFPEKLNRGRFAEGAGFALEGDARLRQCCVQVALPGSHPPVAKGRSRGRIMPRMIPKRALLSRPQADEYSSYYEKYISLISGDDILGALEAQRLQMAQLLAARSERDGNFRYAPDKWTVKEVIGHISDSERVFMYRALRISRGDQTPIEGFEQDDYVRGGKFNDRTLADLAEEFVQVRGATLALLRGLSDEAWPLRGLATNNVVSVRALAYITAGHELHHRRILEEKYFPAIPRA